MASLQPKLNLRVSQRQVLTPGLMQMVSVLALNKIELKDMIQAEITENPVLEELEDSVPLLDHIAEREAERELPAQPVAEEKRSDPFEEIDFGSYFQDYLDPGFRSPQSFEANEKPSIENTLTHRGSLVDHLHWQVGSLPLAHLLRCAVEYILGNLDENGYCTAGREELLHGWVGELAAMRRVSPGLHEDVDGEALLEQAMTLVRSLDPPGIGALDLRECLLLQMEAQRQKHALLREEYGDAEGHAMNGLLEGEGAGISPAERFAFTLDIATRIVESHLAMVGKRDLRELAKVLGVTVEHVGAALEFIRTLDPRPGQRFQHVEVRLIEPDVSFVKRDDVWVASMDDESLPTLRLNRGYRKLLQKGEAEKDVRDYVKDRYRSALQLMRNIEQRKNTILRTCEVIVRRQKDFLEHGVEHMKPMMIKEVAEEIGVHPSTVSRAVSNKYVYTPQGVYELRFFFSEGVNGPEGSGTPLMLLKRKVKKLIEEEDPSKPLTDDQITVLLGKDGFDVTRRTVAKYREDMRIPSTHQRRVRG
jgi:RNA polymerase sigma-54 factor